MIFFNKSEVGSRKSEVFHKKSHGLRPRISHGSEGDVLCGMCGIGKRGQMAEGRFARSQVAGRRDRKSTRLNSSHIPLSRMPSSA